MAVAIDPWILKKVKADFADDGDELRRSRRIAKPCVQFVEALKPRNPFLPPGDQCVLNDKKHAIYGVFTKEAVDCLKADPECGIPLPFTVPKLKGFIVRLCQFQIKPFLCPASVNRSGFVVLINEVKIVTTENQSAIGEPVWIEEDPITRAIVEQLWNSARDAAKRLQTDANLLTGLDQGFSQMPLALGWDGEPGDILNAINFNLHPTEQQALNEIHPPDVPCSLPTVEEDLEDAGDSYSLLEASSKPTGELPANHKHFPPCSNASSQSQQLYVPSLSSGGNPPPVAVVSSEGIVDSRASQTVPVPVPPVGLVDQCMLDRQLDMDITGLTSSGSTVLDRSGPSPVKDTAVDSDSSGQGSGYQTASETTGKPVACLTNSVFDSPSINLRRPPRRVKRRTSAISASGGHDKLQTSEVQLDIAFLNESAVHRRIFDPDWDDDSPTNGSDVEQPLDCSVTHLQASSPAPHGSRKRKMSSPRKVVSVSTIDSLCEVVHSSEVSTGPSGVRSHSPILISSDNQPGVAASSGDTYSVQSSDLFALPSQGLAGSQATGEGLPESNPFDTEHMPDTQHKGMTHAEFNDRFPASMEVLDADAPDCESAPSSAPSVDHPRSNGHSSHVFASQPPDHDMPESNPFTVMPLDSQYAGSGRDACGPRAQSPKVLANVTSDSPPARDSATKASSSEARIGACVETTELNPSVLVDQDSEELVESDLVLEIRRTLQYGQVGLNRLEHKGSWKPVDVKLAAEALHEALTDEHNFWTLGIYET